MTSLISLHQLKADKKRDVFRIGISQFITHQSLDATREGFVDELAKQGYVEGKILRLICKMHRRTKKSKNDFPATSRINDVVLAIARPSAQSEPNSVVQKDEAKRLLKEKGFTVVEKTILDSNNVKAAAESLMAEVDMVFVPTDNIISLTMETVKQVSIKHKVPVFGGSTEMIAVGGLYNYGTNYEELGRQTARMLIHVLKGEKPENIAVELPEKLELHTNQEMADALGIDISKLEGKE